LVVIGFKCSTSCTLTAWATLPAPKNFFFSVSGIVNFLWQLDCATLSRYLISVILDM
jgi:hypothetical protein